MNRYTSSGAQKEWFIITTLKLPFLLYFSRTLMAASVNMLELYFSSGHSLKNIHRCNCFIPLFHAYIILSTT